MVKSESQIDKAITRGSGNCVNNAGDSSSAMKTFDCLLHQRGSFTASIKCEE